MRLWAALWIAIGLAAPVAARADEVADFYRGKQVQIVVGYGAGGGYDFLARLLARHLGAYIPGNPTVVVQNMPGAGSVRAASWLANVAPRDGLVIGAFDRQVPLFAVLGGDAALNFKANDLNWLGTVSSYAEDAFILWARKDAAASSLDDLRRPGGPSLKVGGSAAGSTDDTTVIVLRDVTGLPLDLITGYPDGNSIALALERGEVDARTAGWSSINSTHPDWLRPDGPVRPLIQVGRVTRLSALKDVPTARELARDDKGRAIIEAMELTYQVARPYALPPGVPKDRLEALRKAFMEALASPALREEAAKSNTELSPVDGAQVTKLIAGMEKASPEALAYFKKLLVVPN